MFISHYTKSSLTKYLETPTGGPRSLLLFGALIQLGLTTPLNMVKKKITPLQALKSLDRYFNTELLAIYSEIEQFREGMKTL